MTKANTVTPEMIEALWSATAHGDDDHRLWLREAYDAFFAGRPVPEPRGRGNKEARIAKLEAQIIAMQSSQPLMVTDERKDAALRNARAWVFECWGWLMKTDLDMTCPMQTDPLDIVEQIDAILGIDAANQETGR